MTSCYARSERVFEEGGGSGYFELLVKRYISGMEGIRIRRSSLWMMGVRCELS